MKNKIMSVVAFFAMMAAMTGIAAAYDATVTDHNGTVAATDVFVFPGEQFHWHFQATSISSLVVGTEVDYGMPTIFASPSSAPPPTVTIVTPNSTFPAPSFIPNASNWIDMDSGRDLPPIGCCIPGNVLSTDHPDRIIVTMDPNSPPGAIYRITIPTTAKNGFDEGTASRNVIIINTSTTLTKTANPTTLILTPGGSGMVTYTITETNTGNVPITDTLSDPDLNAPAASCTPSNLPATFTLAPSASTTYTCTKTYNDSEQGIHTNTVTATAHPIVDNVTVTNVTVNESANATVNVATVSTKLTKTANPTNLTLSPGGSGTVTYTINETNTGDVPLMTTVSDPGVPGASCTPPLPDTRLYNPGDSVTFTCTKTYNDSEQGVHTNTVTATSNPIVNNVTVTNVTFNESANATVNVITEAISLNKTVSSSKVENGSSVTYTYNATNTGNTPLTVNISDDQLGVILLPTNLGPGNSTGNITKTVTLSTPNTSITNTATATGVDQTGASVTANASQTVKVIHPNISLTKTPSPTNGTAPLNVTYTYIVNNTGDTALSNVTITDNVFGAVGGPITLNPGVSQTFTKNQTITANTTNIATATGTDQFGVNVTATATANVTVIPPVGNQGCTPGFWKENALKHGASQWPANFTPNETLAAAGFANATVVNLSNTTLLQALQFKGGPGLGGAEQILLRAAVSSLLNSASTGVKFPLTTSQVLSEVNAALATQNRDTILALASQLDQDNNLGCPLSQNT